MWAIGLWVDEQLRGVALIGAPKARAFAATAKGQEWPRPYARLEVVRVAVIEGTPNGCSMLYGACSRAARGMGCDDLLTYTDCDEPGTTLTAANWKADAGLFSGKEASCQSRQRRLRLEHEKSKKRRWWAPWSAHLKSLDAAVAAKD